MEELKQSIETMKTRIGSILDGCEPSIYLYGSVTLHDFKPGWSDIDILVLTEKAMTEAQAGQLVILRQTILREEPDDPYYRSFEGGVLTLRGFLSGEKDRVVYWGTSGEKITDQYALDSFSMSELMDSGILLHGQDVRGRLTRPTFRELKGDVQRHYETIRRHAQVTGRSLYSYGWLLDISRCIYTLRTGKIISKTGAGEWALQEALCPCAGALARAVTVRKDPASYENEKAIMAYAETLGGAVQKYADVLERELAETPDS